MTLKTESDVAADATLTDRRRPGRRADVNPALIPMLRTSELPDQLAETIEFDEPDQASAARGIVTGVALSAPLWIGIAYLGRWILS